MNRKRQGFWRQTGLLAAKDLKIFARDRGTLFFALLMPLAFVFLFSMILGGVFGGADKAFTVYVATDEPAGSVSQMIIDAMVEAKNPSGAGSATGASGGASGDSNGAEFLGGLEVRQMGASEAADLLARDKSGGYLYFPADFTEDIQSGQPTTITAYVNPASPTTRAALLSIAGAIAAEFESREVMAVSIAELAFPAGLSGGAFPSSGGGSAGVAGGSPEAGGAGAGQAGVKVIYEKVGDIRAARPADVLISGYLTMFVFFALALTAETLVGEKENSTLDRLMAGSATRLSIIAGKMLGAFGRGLIQIVVFWTAGVLLFDVYMGPHPAVVVGISLLLTLAASGVGVFLASLARTSRSAGSMAVFVSLTLAAFGGCWWPLFIMPKWLQTLAKVTPHAWANSAFNKLMVFGGDPGSVVPEMLALSVFALLFGGLAIWRFRVD